MAFAPATFPHRIGMGTVIAIGYGARPAAISGAICGFTRILIADACALPVSAAVRALAAVRISHTRTAPIARRIGFRPAITVGHTGRACCLIGAPGPDLCGRAIDDGGRPRESCAAYNGAQK
ncbi:MAG: hypothetical protein DHS20C06_02270 [Hyphobacterium sp.]|nr:MAG: hypothetical protein DHS20C06_02270 [Hyphobacterium sp.]